MTTNLFHRYTRLHHTTLDCITLHLKLSITHSTTVLRQVCAPENSGQVVSELSSHPQVLADVLSLSAASDAARMCAARGIPFEGPGNIPCIEALRDEAACVVPDDSYQASLTLLQRSNFFFQENEI